MVFLGKKTEIILSFLRLHWMYCISDPIADYEGDSISSKGFLPTVVVIMVIWIKFTHSSHFSSQFLKCQCLCHLLFDCIQFTLEKTMAPHSVLLPGKSHGQRSLVGCSPWGRKESDTTEQLHFHFSLSFFGEGNDNPLQCSCLENPRDGGAWWAAVYGVAQSWTWLKWLSSSLPWFMGLTY